MLEMARVTNRSGFYTQVFMDGCEVKNLSIYAVFLGYNSRSAKFMPTCLQVNLETSLVTGPRLAHSVPSCPGLQAIFRRVPYLGSLLHADAMFGKSIAPFIDLEMQIRNCLTVHVHMYFRT